MAITSAVANQAKVDLLTLLAAHTLKLALYVAGSLGKDSTVYSATGEASGAGYSAGGVTLTSPVVSLSGDTATLDFADAVWAAATLTNVLGAVLYDASNSNHVVAVFAFAFPVSSVGTEFRVSIPSGLVSLAP